MTLRWSENAPRRAGPPPARTSSRRAPGLLALLAAAALAAAPAGAPAQAQSAGATESAARPAPSPDPATAASPAGVAAPPATTESPEDQEDELVRRCEVPDDAAANDDLLTGFTQALTAAASPVTVVVLTSLRASGKGDELGADGFPAQLQARLSSRLAERGVRVNLKVETVGKTRALAGDLTALIKQRVLPLKPALVIWQVGRADARKGNPPYRFNNSLTEGLELLQQQGIDTVLADIQFHPQFEALYRTDDYRNYVRWIAGKRDLPLLRRYEMINHWAVSDLIDLDSGSDADQRAAYRFIQECLAHQATRLIMGAAGLAP